MPNRPDVPDVIRSRHLPGLRALLRRTRPAGAALLAAAVLAGCGGGGSGGASAPQISVALSSPYALEADGRIVFTVTVLNALATDEFIRYSTNDLGRAVAGYAHGGAACGAGVDYVSANSVSLRVPAGTTSLTVPITTCDDNVFQANKRFSLSIAGAVNSPVASMGTIVNDDAGGLNDTGIATCVNAAGSATACPASGLAGQDAETGRDAIAVTQSSADGAAGFSYTKIGASGETLAANAGSWSCIRDKVTGLLWQQEQGATTPSTSTFADLQARMTTANATNLCGTATWRIPEVVELGSLVHAGKTTGVAIDSTWFTDTSALGNQAKALYWSNTTAPADPTTAWVVDFSIGTVGVRNKAPSAGSNLSGRLVSGAQPAASSAAPCVAGSATAAGDRFTANGDGTVTDKSTQLMWAQCSVGQSGSACATGTATPKNWRDALAQVASANSSAYLGYTDWRLPNRNELGSLVERACSSPAVNRVYFPATSPSSYWTSSPSLTTGAQAWYVDFVDGDVAPGDTSGNRSLRLLRAGQ